MTPLDPELLAACVTELAERAYQTAKAKGRYEQPSEFGTHLAGVHGEVSEILDAYSFLEFEAWVDAEDGKPQGVASEMADVVISILSLARRYDLPIAAALLRKMAFNETRPPRHWQK